MKNHNDIIKILGLEKNEKKPPKQEEFKYPIWPIPVAITILALIIAALIYNNYALQKHEARIVEQKKLKELQLAEERKNQIQYAKVAFLDSFPPAVRIHQDGKQLFAKTPENTVTYFTAKKDAIINNIPVKQDTVVSFTFHSEAFKTLQRTIPIYDWFPTNDDNIPLQKTFRKITLEPVQTPLFPQCEQIAALTPQYKNTCTVSVAQELMTRLQYQKNSDELDNEQKERNTAALLNPDFAPDIPPVKNLTGTIIVTSDIPETKLFFLNEPLVVINENNTITQIKLQPGKPHNFSTYGNNKQIPLARNLSIRLEAPGFPPFVAEILPHQWHCTPKNIEDIKQIIPPEFITQEDPQPLMHHLCDYTIEINVNFKDIPGEILQDKS